MILILPSHAGWKAWVDLGTAVAVCSPHPRLEIAAAVAINTTGGGVVWTWVLTLQSDALTTRPLWVISPRKKTTGFSARNDSIQFDSIRCSQVTELIRAIIGNGCKWKAVIWRQTQLFCWPVQKCRQRWETTKMNTVQEMIRNGMRTQLNQYSPTDSM